MAGRLRLIAVTDGSDTFWPTLIITDQIYATMSGDKRLAEGYQKHANRHRDLTALFVGVSTEAIDQLDDSPAWECETEG